MEEKYPPTPNYQSQEEQQMGINEGDLQFQKKEIKTKRRRKIIFSLSFVVIILMFITFLFFKQSKKEKVETSKESSPPTITPLEESLEKSFYINSTNSLTPVVGYTWLDNKLLYANSNGIFETTSNKKVIEDKIKYINFNFVGQAVYLNINNSWFFVDINSQEKKEIKLEAEKAWVNNGEKILFVNKNKIISYDLASEKQLEIELLGKITKITTSKNQNSFVINRQSSVVNEVEFYNYELDKINSFSLKESESLVSASFNLEKILTHNTSDKEIIIKNITGDSEKKFKLLKDAEIFANWINNNEIILIETFESNLKGRETNNIWLINDSNNTRKLLANSNPIPKKLLVDFEIQADKNRRVIPLIENQGKLWLLSLTPDLFPAYDVDEGLVFFKILESQKGSH